MPKIIVEADIPGSEPALRTLSERIVADHRDGLHYRAQLVERITWAAADAEALERTIEMAQADARSPAGTPTIDARAPERRPAPAALSV